MILRTIFIVSILQILIACSMGTVSIKSYSDTNLSEQNLYAWYGMPKVKSGEAKSYDFGAAEFVEKKLVEILQERNFIETNVDKAQVLLALHIQLQESLEIENQYRQKTAVGVFSEGDDTNNSSGNTLLPDIKSPLYSGQQRGSISITIYDAKSKDLLKKGTATVIFPHDLNNQNELLHLTDTLHRLVNKLFS